MSAARCRQCGKEMFGTQEAAQGRLEEVRADHAWSDKLPVRVYRAPACGWWHLTSRPDMKRDARTGRRKVHAMGEGR